MKRNQSSELFNPIILSISSFFLIILSLISHPLNGQFKNTNTFQSVQEAFTDGVIDGYNIYLPQSAKNGENFPVILYLQCEEGIGGGIGKALKWGLPSMILQSNKNSETLNQYLLDSFIVVVPHMKDGSFNERQWYNQEQAIQYLLDKVIHENNVDESRIYIMGHGRGGHGTWGLSAKMDIFAAAVPICGAIHGIRMYNKLYNLPIWIFHNNEDKLVSYKETKRVLAKLESGQSTFTRKTNVYFSNEKEIRDNKLLTTYQKEGHNAWDATYSSPDLYRWLLSKQKS